MPDDACRWPAARSRRGKARTPTAREARKQSCRAVSGSRRADAGTRRSPSCKPQRLASNCCTATARSFAGLLTLLEKEYATATDETRARAAGSVPRPGRLRGLRRLAAAARSPRRAARRQGDSRDHAAAVGERAAFFAALAVPTPRISRSREPLVARDRAAAGVSGQGRASTISRSTARPTRSAAASCSACGWPPASARGWSACCYVLDEPSIGLHPRDNQRLIDALRDLQQQGNTVLVVEHDEAMMRQADWLIDIGPGAGRHGGQIVAAGHAGRSRRPIRTRSPGGICRASCRSHVPAERRTVGQDAVDRDRRGDDATTCKNVDVAVSAGRVHLRHRRQRLGQELAGQRHAGPGARAAA